MSLEKMVKSGIVYLIGAGPGDPGLITVKGRQCLERATVVVYDYLANSQLLDYAPAAAERIYVGKTRGRHHAPQEEINALLVRRAQEGEVVVRLKGGDPFIFGRGGEEALALHDAGIPFEIVPGVTSGFAVAAYAGIPLTHRDFTTSLGLVTGHEDPARKMSSLDWSKLSTGVGTLVFYMGMANLSLLTEQLQAHGRSGATPVAVIQWGTTPKQRTVKGTLADIVGKVQQANLKPPAIIVVGEVVNLRDQLAWFDNRPLFGKRILVTRSAEQAGSFVADLEALGAEAVSLPVIAIIPPTSWAELDGEIAELARTDVLVLTSTNAVDMFFSRLAASGKDGRALHSVQVAAVGPKTAQAIRQHGIVPDLVPEDYRAEGLIEMLAAQGVAGQRILYPKAALARDIIPRELTALGADVRAPLAYQTVAPEQGAERLQEILAQGPLDAVTFTSSSTVDNLLAMAGPEARTALEQAALFSIGPLTSATMRRHGLNVAGEPAKYTLEGLLTCIQEYFSGHYSDRL